MSVQAYQQLQDLQSLLQPIQQNNVPDCWFNRQPQEQYSSIRLYHTFFDMEPRHSIFRYLWKAAAILRYNFFFWLLIHDRINTRNLLQRKTFNVPSASCVLCDHETDETSYHLIWDYPFALGCWDSITTHRQRGISIYDEIINSRFAYPKGIAMDIIIMGSWHIWMQRNDFIFKNKIPSITNWRRRMRKDLNLLQHRIKAKHSQTLTDWTRDFFN